MSFILVLLFEQKQRKITMTYAGNYWQTSGLATLEYGRKKGAMKYEAMMSVRLTERPGRAPDLWNNANNFLTAKLEGYVRFFLNFLRMLFSKALQHGAVSSTASSTAQLKVCMRKGWMSGKYYLLMESLCASVTPGSAVQVVPLAAEDSCEYAGTKAEELDAWHFITI